MGLCGAPTAEQTLGDAGIYCTDGSRVSRTGPRLGASPRLAGQHARHFEVDPDSPGAGNEQLHPTSTMAPFFRGEVLLLPRDTSGAIAAYRTSIERDPASHARPRLMQMRAP